MPPTGPDDANSGFGSPFPSNSLTQALESLGHTLKFIEKWLQCFETN